MIGQLSGKNIFPGNEWQTVTPESQGVNSNKLAEAMQYLKDGTGKNGVSQVVVIKNEYIIWQGDDIDNKHVIWSCSKSYMSTCLGLLWGTENARLIRGKRLFP